MNIRRWETIRS